MITVGFKTDKGKKRSDNEDSLFVIPDKKIFIVADGVGGQNSGELASRMTVGYMAQFVCLNPIEEAKTGSELKSYFMKLFSGANSLVHEKATSEKSNYGMATTTVLCYIRENTAYFVNVGDSRAYLIRDGRSYQITEDHSFVQTMIFPAISRLIATRDSLIFTMRFPLMVLITVTAPPATKPRSSRCFLSSSLPPTRRMTVSSPGFAYTRGIMQVPPLKRFLWLEKTNNRRKEIVSPF